MKTIVFESDGEFLPKGQYLVTIVDENHQELAFKPKGFRVWGPPLYGRLTDHSSGVARHDV